MHIDLDIRQLITPEQAWHYQAVPGHQAEGAITFLIAEGQDGSQLAEELEILLGQRIVLDYVDEAALKRALTEHYPISHNGNSKPINADYLGAQEDHLDKLINTAKSLNSSDIHIEPSEDHGRIRFRIDGNLVERYKVDLAHMPGMINKIKIRARIDISEKRLPQDGRIMVEDAGSRIDVRVSTIPTMHGEKVVLRLLGRNALHLEIGSLGLDGQDLDSYSESISHSNGLILISGPTGSGKTTTLYATLNRLNNSNRNIVTIEDPIEYTLEGLNQVQLQEKIGLTYAKALRTFLRQDPDIIMVGEIRDGDTASTAIRASLTGHLVLSTIHTNSAWGAVSRLIDLGVPNYLLASTLRVCVAQRLVRLLCEYCKQEEQVNQSNIPHGLLDGEEMDKHCVAVGCEKCFYTGYSGRKAIFEVIPIDRKLSAFIKDNKLDMADKLDELGVETLKMKALRLLKNKESSLEEVYSLLLN